MLIIGTHLSTSNLKSGSSTNDIISKSIEVGANAAQIFTAPPRQWGISSIAKNEKVGKPFDGFYLVSHSGYLNNIASPDEKILTNTINSLKMECKRCQELEIKYLVIHGGSSKGSDRTEALDRAINTILTISKDLNGKHPCILIENSTISKNNTKLASCIEDYRYIFKKLQHINVGACIDLGHLYVSGVDVSDEYEFSNYFEELDKALLDHKVEVLHISDNKGSLGSNKDVHASLGSDEGNIGLDHVKHAVSHPITKNTIKILETPNHEIHKKEIEIVKELYIQNAY